MAIDILHRWTGAVLFRSEKATMKEAVAEAVSVAAPLRYALLREQDLTGAMLAGADFANADLRDAKVAGSNLSGASVTGAVLRGADLSGTMAYALGGQGADFGGANLQNANLTDAKLTTANLAYVDARGAYLAGADLTGALVSGVTLDTGLSGDVHLTTGETLDEFRTVVGPALLAAGGTAVPPAAWEATTFAEAPLGIAFGVTSVAEMPMLYQPRGTQWWGLYVDGLLVSPTGRASPAMPTRPYRGVWQPQPPPR